MSVCVSLVLFFCLLCFVFLGKEKALRFSTTLMRYAGKFPQVYCIFSSTFFSLFQNKDKKFRTIFNCMLSTFFFQFNAVIGKTGWLTVKHVQVFAWVLKLKRVHHYCGNYRAQFCVVVFFFSFLCLVSSTMYMSLLQLPIYFCLYFLMQGCSICVQVFLLFLQDYIFSLFVFDLVGVVT